MGVNEETLSELRDKRQAVNETIAEKKLELTKLNIAILKQLRRMGKEEYTADGLTTQIINRHRTEYDWDAIKNSVKADVWASLVREVPDPELLHKAINDGIVEAKVIAKHVDEVAFGDPYIKIAAAKRQEDD